MKELWLLSDRSNKHRLIQLCYSSRYMKDSMFRLVILEMRHVSKQQGLYGIMKVFLVGKMAPWETFGKMATYVLLVFYQQTWKLVEIILENFKFFFFGMRPFFVFSSNSCLTFKVLHSFKYMIISCYNLSLQCEILHLL